MNNLPYHPIPRVVKRIEYATGDPGDGTVSIQELSSSQRKFRIGIHTIDGAGELNLSPRTFLTLLKAMIAFNEAPSGED